MAEDLRRFRAERATLRRLFTLNTNLLETVLKTDPVDIDKVNLEFSKVADKAERMFVLDDRIRDALFSDDSLFGDDSDTDKAPREIDKELEGVEAYREVWCTIVTQRQTLLDKRLVKVEPPGSVRSMNSVAEGLGLKMKLPKLDLRQFDIKPDTWISFWAAFKKIDESEEIDAEDKFQLLLRMAKEGTVARDLLEGYPPSAANYPKALAHLKQRFGREELLIEHNVRELLGLVLTQAKSGISVAELRPHCDRLESKLMALESLGLTSDKFACILMPLVESSLPEGVLRAWEKARPTEESQLDSVQQMELLRAFLKKTVISEERVVMAKNAFGETSAPVDKATKPSRKPQPEKRPTTAAGLVNHESGGDGCAFCAGAHPSEYCRKAREMTSDSRIKALKEKSLCFKCLRKFHVGRRCKTTPHCLVCSKNHATVMCSEPLKKNNDSNCTSEKPPESTEKNLSNTSQVPVLMQTLQVRVIPSVGPPVTARVLLDTGSQRSYISNQLARKMGYESMGVENIVHALFGGQSTDVRTHQRYKVRLQALSSPYRCNFDVLATETICLTVPCIPGGPWISELQKKNISISDTSDGPVDILVGSDVAGKLFTGRREVLSGGLVAMETDLGWVLMGRIRNQETDTMMNVTSMCAMDLTPEELWKLDVLGIHDPADVSTNEEARAAAHERFLNTVKTLDDGRYEVSLPWLVGHPILPTGFQQAASRLEATVKRLRAQGLFTDYDGVLKEWFQDGIVEEVTHEDWNMGHYLPHRAVVKEGSTTRVRPVFDASAGKPNLNQCLEKGENLIEQIPSVLLKFRLKEIGVISDIRRAFLQISVEKSDRDYLRFLWVDSSGGVRIYRHKRVVFGVTSSPYLLGAVINHHLDKCGERAANGGAPYDASTILQLRGSLYVDNCVTSVGSQEDLDAFVKQAKEIFLEACFDLRGWEWSDPSLTNATYTPVLGVLWDRKLDVLKVNPPKIGNVEKVTRRTVLSAGQKLFDPLGTCAPTALVPRLIVQDSWKDGGSWDTPLSEKSRKEFEKWANEVQALSEVEIPRWIRASAKESDTSLHTFCDASQLAFAAVSFLRVESAEGVFVTLVAAKSRVAPLKRVTIPRLELLAATIGARLASNILKEVGQVKCFFWTDSTTVLSWIRRDEPWGVFVFNRVREIRNKTHLKDWRHVPGTQNPADLASRGCNPKAFSTSRWWEGPDWLRAPALEWPDAEGEHNECEILEERRKTAITSVVTSPDALTSASFGKFSKHSRNLRVIAWVIRFLFNKFSKKEKLEGELSLKEIERAEKLMIAMIQREVFDGLKDRALKQLKPQKGVDGLIRLRTKIWALRDSEDFRSPIILPTNHEVVTRLVLETHEKNGHVVGQNLLNLLRERFWIVRGRQAIKRILAKCAICQRHRTKSLEVESPPLPENRVRDASAFEICGVDLAGPLYLADGHKVWIALFTCAIYRAVHLEIVSSLSTEAFLMSFRRFIAIRGRPSIIYSDNGLNFRGAYNALQEVDWSKIAMKGTMNRIDWRFNPPKAAWWGGFWERLVGVVKVILRKVLGKASLSHEELATLIYECATYVNHRPLTYVSENPDDPIPITPQMFLGDLPCDGVPDLDVIDTNSLKRKLQRRVLLKEELRRRFRIEYLGQLNFAPGGFQEKRSPKVGEVVIIGSEGNKRIDWPLAVIEELIIGKDGKCRAVVLRTASGRLSRAIQHVFPLEIDSQEPGTAPESVDSSVADEDSETLTSSESTEDISAALNRPVLDVQDDQENPDDDPSPISSPEKAQEVVHTKRPSVRKQICVEKISETRCGRKVKLPVKYSL